MLKPSLSCLNYCPLAFLVCTLLLSSPGVATTGYKSVKIAQQTQTTSSNFKISADKAFAEADKLYQIGSVESLKQAITKFEQAVILYSQAGEKGLEALSLAYMGYIYSSLGEKQKALEFYNQALPIFREVGDKGGEASLLTVMGLVHSDLGEKQKALDFYNQALPILRVVGNRIMENSILSVMGLVHSDLGILRAVGNRSMEATTLNNIGLVYSDLGEKQKALDFYNQALPIFRVVGNKNMEATTLSNIGLIYSDLGEKQKALDFYNQAFPILRAVGNRGMEATNLKNIGLVYSDLGEKQKALTFYNQALLMYRSVGDRVGEANTNRNLASLQRSQGNLAEAFQQMQYAINIIEELRTKITSPELRTSYFATVQSYYKFYIDLLMQLHKQQPSKGYDAIALQASESARARSLLELITEANADIRTGVDAKLLQAERNIQQQLDNHEKHRIQLLSGKYTSEQKRALETQTAKLLDQYQDIQTKIRINSPRYAAITQPQPLTLAQIQQRVLDEDTILLEYSLGEEKSYLWAITKRGMTSYELPKSGEIETLVKNFRNEIVKPSSNKKTIVKASAQLTKILIEPVAEKLGNKRLVIVGDGALQYLPFTALSIPNSQKYQPLIINHEIVTLPSASTVALLRTEQKGRKTALKSLAMLADPVFTTDDQRFIDKGKPTKLNTDNLENLVLKRAVGNTEIQFNRLPFTRKEAETILKLVPKNQSLQAYDFSANRDFVTNPQLSQYRIIHFATHGIIDSKQPELSGLVLSLFNDKGKPENGFLRLHDIFNLNLSADLVVLSACQTGLGEEIKGEGLVGLTTGFIYAGSPRVVMSLWNVDDEGTSVLMEKFYQKMLKDGLKPSAALRQAQIEMLQDERFSKPDYWAAFTLQGEWR
ncbi:CHAT domain-containing protein [Anabaena sp. WFMT]|uniref:CHAT domain-containing protein n=1 Tax=Anabaena sp. WFMT TaxID=3449730 RepID=UPI003F214206